jgi:hypothetical protein
MSDTANPDNAGTEIAGTNGITRAAATVESSLAARARHLARDVHSLGAGPLAYLFAEIVAASSGALGRIEAYAVLTPYADFIAAYMPHQRPCVWRIR